MANPHPEITFRVNLELNKTEAIGPKTNEKNPGILSPDYHKSLQTATGHEMARTYYEDRVNHRSCNIGLAVLGSSQSPRPHPGGNVLGMKDDEQLTLYGQQALEVRKKYTSGTWNDNTPTGGLGAILEVVS